MIKILLILVLCVGVGVAVYFKFFKTDTKTPIISSGILTNQQDAPVETRLQTIEQAILELAKEINTLKTQSPSTTANSNPATSLSSPQSTDASIQDLKTRVAALEASSKSSQTTTTSTTKPPLYIPLSSGGSSGDQNWINLPGYIVTIDASNYSGYKNMQLETVMRLNQPGGSVNSRLFNSTDNSVVSNSSSSVSSTDFGVGQSSTFTLPQGNKTYQVQVQSTNGTTAFFELARIKVNY